MIAGRGHRVGRLETFTANMPAVRFYSRNGWSAVERGSEDLGVAARIRFQEVLG